MEARERERESSSFSFIGWERNTMLYTDGCDPGKGRKLEIHVKVDKREWHPVCEGKVGFSQKHR